MVNRQNKISYVRNVVMQCNTITFFYFLFLQTAMHLYLILENSSMIDRPRRRPDSPPTSA